LINSVYICQILQIMKHLIMQVSSSSC
jgi:hypothetical protein